MTARPFRAGDRVRWRVPEDKSGVGAREWLRANGFLFEGESVVEDRGVPPPPTGVWIKAMRVAIFAGWIEHIDDAPAHRDPDKTCRWCHGTGAVLLVFSNVPCDCVRGGS